MFLYVKLESDPRGAPPAHPGSGWKDRYSARQRIGGLILAYARAAGQVLHSNGLPPIPELRHALAQHVTGWNFSAWWGASCVLAFTTDSLGTSHAAAVRLAPYRKRGPIKEAQQPRSESCQAHGSCLIYKASCRALHCCCTQELASCTTPSLSRQEASSWVKQQRSAASPHRCQARDHLAYPTALCQPGHQPSLISCCCAVEPSPCVSSGTRWSRR